jgi:ureidoacrylate peracid hydrolase
VTTLSRNVPIDPAHAALLIIDVQNYCAHNKGSEWKALSPDEMEQKLGYYFAALRDSTLPNIRRLQEACRKGRIEVMYAVIENMTKDGRDRSLDYKISGLDVPRGSWDAQVLDEVAPAPDEMIFQKTSSNVFVSTNIDYVLRNLGVRSLIIAGLVTDQCIEGAVRDACDLGYLVTLATDACNTYTAQRHAESLIGIRGYCRQRDTAALVQEISALTGGCGRSGGER